MLKCLKTSIGKRQVCLQRELLLEQQESKCYPVRMQRKYMQIVQQQR